MTSSSPTLVLPAIDGSVPVDIAIDFHLKHNPKHVFAVLYDVESRSQTKVTYQHLAHAVHQAAHLLNADQAFPQGKNIGILISTDTIAYITMVLGAIPMGLV
ncbi:hypothetical protein FRC07_011072, partial [Ceratobasidium sp. 392]